MEGYNWLVFGGLFFIDMFIISSADISGFYADNILQQTIAVPKLRNRDKEDMQDEILNLLGLDHVPNPVRQRYYNRKTSAPQFMLDLYKNLQNDDALIHNEELHRHELRRFNSTDKAIQAINTADMIMSFVNHIDESTRIRHDRERKYYFDFREVSAEEMITEAELRLYKITAKERFLNELFNFEVYQMRQGEDPEDKFLELVDSVIVNSTYEGWLVLNVTTAAMSWQNFPHTNMGLLLAVTDLNGSKRHPKDVEILGMKAIETKRPFMVALFKHAIVHSRQTRATKKRGKRRRKKGDKDSLNENIEDIGGETATQRYSKRQCQRRTLYVSFKDLGWQDWIIAPEGYSAYYCNGECSFPLNAHMNATNHAIVQTLVHLMNPLAVPKPCCAPSKLSAISVLYFDDESNVILKKYRNMMVRSCGCH